MRTKQEDSSGAVPRWLAVNDALIASRCLVYQLWLKTLHDEPESIPASRTCYLDVACVFVPINTCNICVSFSSLHISLISDMRDLSSHESSNYPSPSTLIMPLAGLVLAGYASWRMFCVFLMEIKAFSADLSRPGTQGKHSMHFYIAVLYLQRKGKSIAAAEGAESGVEENGPCGEWFEENSITTNEGRREQRKPDIYWRQWLSSRMEGT